MSANGPIVAPCRWTECEKWRGRGVRKISKNSSLHLCNEYPFYTHCLKKLLHCENVASNIFGGHTSTGGSLSSEYSVTKIQYNEDNTMWRWFVLALKKCRLSHLEQPGAEGLPQLRWVMANESGDRTRATATHCVFKAWLMLFMALEPLLHRNSLL